MAPSRDWLDSPNPGTYVDQLESTHARRRALDATTLRLYWGSPRSIGDRVDTEDTVMDDRRTRDNSVGGSGFNLVRMLIDAFLALTVRTSSIRVMPIGGKFALQKASKNLEKFIRGVLNSVDFPDKLYRVAADACTVRPGGALKWFVKDDVVTCEKVDPTTLHWDYGEGPEPSRLVQITYAPKHKVADMFPGKTKEIMSAPVENPRVIMNVDLTTQAIADRCRVVEIWSLPRGGKAGRHEIIVGRSIKVLAEPWEMPMFPVVLYKAWPSYRDYAGKPLAEALIKYQRGINRAVRIILDSAEGCVPRAFQKITEDHESFTRMPFEKVIYTDTPPQIQVANAIPEQLYQLIEVIKQNATQEIGVNEASVAGSKPAGLTAAVSIREASDAQSQRLYHPTRGLEDFQKACAKVILFLAKDAYKTKGAIYRAPESALIEEINFQDIDLREDQYTLEVTAASSFPTTSAARRQTITELEEGGYITKPEAMRMLQIVDLESTLDRANARRDYAEWCVSEALYEGKVNVPSEYLGQEGIMELVEIGKLEFLRAQMSFVDTPYENLAALRKLIAMAEALLTPIASPPAAPPEAAPPTGPPPGNPNTPEPLPPVTPTV